MDGGSGDPGCLECARVVEDRGPVVAGPDVADLAVAQAVDVHAIPLNMPPAGGDAQDRAFLRAAHHHAHHDLVALAEDVVDGDVRVGERGDNPGEQPGDVGTARDRAHRTAVPLHVRIKEVGRVTAVVLVDDVLEERFHHALVRPYARTAIPRLRRLLGAVHGGRHRRVRGDADDCQASGGEGAGGQGNALQPLHDHLLRTGPLEGLDLTVHVNTRANDLIDQVISICTTAV